jgi:hypothetical protein
LVRLVIEDLRTIGGARDRGQRVILRAAKLWVHPHVVGQRDCSSSAPGHAIKADQGIAVYPGSDFPRLPIMRLRVIAKNNLILKVDGRRREATLRTPFKWWAFG